MNRIEMFALAGLLAALMIDGYAKVGLVKYVLLPMNIYLLYVIGHQIVCSNEECHSQWVETSLLVVFYVSLMGGILGALLEISESALRLTLDHGVGKLVNPLDVLFHELAVVLNPIAWGWMLAATAMILDKRLTIARQIAGISLD